MDFEVLNIIDIWHPQGRAPFYLTDVNTGFKFLTQALEIGLDWTISISSILGVLRMVKVQSSLETNLWKLPALY